MTDRIPEDWLDQIDKNEYHEEFGAASKILIEALGGYFGMENSSQDDVVIALTERWDKSLEKVFDILTTAVRSKVMISLFARHWGHLFPRDEGDSLILTPEVLAMVHCQSVREILASIAGNRKKSREVDLFYEWLDMDVDFIN